MDVQSLTTFKIIFAEDTQTSAMIGLFTLKKIAKEINELYSDILVDVKHYANGKVAYEAILESKPNLVVTDNHMPHMTGVEIANKLGGRYPIVVQSATEQENFKKIFSHGSLGGKLDGSKSEALSSIITELLPPKQEK